MKIAERNIPAFLRGKPYYDNNEDFCLGETLEEAGRILKEIAEHSGNEEGKNERTNRLGRSDESS
jgi:hypothetical protein